MLLSKNNKKISRLCRKKYSGSLRYVIENHKRKLLTYLNNLGDELTQTKTIIYQEKYIKQLKKKQKKKNFPNFRH